MNKKKLIVFSSLSLLTVTAFMLFQNATLNPNYQGIGILPGRSIFYYTPVSKGKSFLLDPKKFMSQTLKLPLDGFTFSVSAPQEVEPAQEVEYRFENILSKLKDLKSDPVVWNDKKDSLRKYMLPLVHMARLVGECKGTQSTNMQGEVYQIAPNRYDIDCFDIEKDDADLLSFYADYKGALVFSRETNAPSVFIDHEYYFNYSISLGAVVKHAFATKGFNSVEDARKYVLRRLSSIGDHMASLAHRIHPDVNIYALALKFQKGFDVKLNKQKKISTVAFLDEADVTGIIFYHMLQSAKRNGYKFKLIEGGESSVWYPKYSPEYSAHRMITQEKMLKAFTHTFAANLELGAPITFWENFERDYREDDGFKRRKPVNLQVTATQLEHLAPIFKDIVKARKHIWIYPKTAGVHSYDVFDTKEKNAGFVIKVSDLIQQTKRDCFYERCAYKK